MLERVEPTSHRRRSRLAVDINNFHFHIDQVPISIDPQSNCTTNASMFELFGQIIDASNRLAIGGGNDIAKGFGRRIHCTQERTFSRGPRPYSSDDYALDSQPSSKGVVAWNNANTWYWYPTIADNIGHDTFYNVDRDGKSQGGARPRY